MFRTYTCGELRLADAGKNVTLAGWVQRTRKMGGMTFVDLRDRYGITQLVFNTDVNAELCERANHLGREFVIQVKGQVSERSSKNANLPTGDIEIIVSELNVLNTALTPPFTIEDNTDGGDDLRMKYRYLDLRRTAVRKNLELRHRMTMEVRRYLDSKGFLEVETPMLIGSTPEGARDFVVPSRMNPGQFYALPQSPQTLKQLLMVSGFDRYFQIVKCFRDEDLRADRQPEFTQIDCEMSFVEQEDIIQMFEGMAKHLFKELRGVELTEPFIRMPWADAMKYYGSDKPDLRFGMKFVELMDILKGYGFSVFDNAAYIGGICAEGAAHYTRKQLDQLTEFVKRPQIGTGIGQYLNDLSNLNVDIVPNPDETGKMQALPMLGWYAGLQYNISPKVFLSSTYSMSRLYSENGNPANEPSTYRYGQYFVANLFWNVTPNMQVGAEYLRGWRTNFDNSTNHANRMNLLVQYSF